MRKLKIYALIAIVGIYVSLAGALHILAKEGFIKKSEVAEKNTSYIDISLNYKAAADFFNEKMVRKNGHIDLYYLNNGTFEQHNYTNSEAASYYLLWTAKAGMKKEFDNELRFIQEKMMHPAGYIMWKLTDKDTVEEDGENVATDADLRVIKAIMIAEKKWGSGYSNVLDKIALGLELVGITEDGYLSPYGGGSAENPWTGNEVWLSYTNFEVFEKLAKKRGEPWITLNSKMKNATLNAQIQNGLYNSQLTNKRQYGNGIDGGGYSINSMWIMVRSAESGDAELMESANKSLDFYRRRFEVDGVLYTQFTSNGEPLSSYDSPWVYALVGRAAVALGDLEFANKMMEKLVEMQVIEESPIFGAIPEGRDKERVGQFTMQESILTMQDYMEATE